MGKFSNSTILGITFTILSKLKFLPWCSGSFNLAKLLHSWTSTARRASSVLSSAFPDSSNINYAILTFCLLLSVALSDSGAFTLSGATSTDFLQRIRGIPSEFFLFARLLRVSLHLAHHKHTKFFFSFFVCPDRQCSFRLTPLQISKPPTSQSSASVEAKSHSFSPSQRRTLPSSRFSSASVSPFSLLASSSDESTSNLSFFFSLGGILQWEDSELVLVLDSALIFPFKLYLSRTSRNTDLESLTVGTIFRFRKSTGSHLRFAPIRG